MFKIYRMPEQGEQFCIGVDCSQGGDDFNEAHFLSRQKLDIPIVYKSHGVAAKMTTDLFPWLEWLFDKTGVPPCIGYERNNGGGSEMDRLKALNRNGKYILFTMPKFGTTDQETETNQLGWNTSTASRPKLIGDWKIVIDDKLVRIYSDDTVSQHKTFVVNNQGKPEAARGSHDDGVIAPAIAWQIYQNAPQPISSMSEWDNINAGLANKWRI